MQAEAPPDELERLAALRRLLVLDTPPERQFDELADVARRVCQTPTALITFVDRDRQWFKARLGFERPETPRQIAFCAHTLLEGDLLVVPDAVIDPRFADNPLVTQAPQIRFYAGVPLLSPDRRAVGTLCVIDRVPRELGPEQLDTLRLLAHQAMALLELRARRADEAVRQAEQLETLGRLAACVAHDFNNLLTVVLGSCQLALQDLGADPGNGRARGSAACSLLLDIEQAAESGARLTRQLLAMGSPGDERLEEQDLSDLLQRQQGVIERLVGSEIEVRLELTRPLPPVRADAARLEQVLLNLVSNARDAMPKGGTLVLSTRVERFAPELSQPSTASGGDHVVLSVRDTGGGFAPEVRAHMFEPFVSTKGRGHGTGLGLASVLAVARGYGGHVNVRSTLGEGATVEVLLPVSSAGGGPARDAPPAPGSDRAARVLVVEDSRAVRVLMSRVLASRGYDVLEAGSASQALAAARASSTPIELLLTDVALRDQDGAWLADELQAEQPELKVLFASGLTPKQIDQPLRLGPSRAFLGKPFSPEHLLVKVRGLLSGASAGEGRPAR